MSLNRRSTSATGAGILLIVALSGCSLVATNDAPEAVLPSPAPVETSETNEPNDSQPEPDVLEDSDTTDNIVTLTPEEVTDPVVWDRSTPGGDFKIGQGVPPGFPAGVPVYTDVWIKDSFLSFDSAGRAAVGVDFNVPLEGIDPLVAEFENQGYRININERYEEDQRVLIEMESASYLVVLTSAWGVEGGKTGIIDPVLNYTIVWKTN